LLDGLELRLGVEREDHFVAGVADDFQISSLQRRGNRVFL